MATIRKAFITALIIFFSFPAISRGSREISIIHDGKSIAKVSAEVAETPEEQQKGLMFRKELAAGRGMFFVFSKDTSFPFWMENTYVPLDIIFIGGDKKIVDIREGAVPFSKELLYSSKPYRYSLEVPAGFVRKHGIKRGDIVR